MLPHRQHTGSTQAAHRRTGVGARRAVWELEAGCWRWGAVLEVVGAWGGAVGGKKCGSNHVGVAGSRGQFTGVILARVTVRTFSCCGDTLRRFVLLYTTCWPLLPQKPACWPRLCDGRPIDTGAPRARGPPRRPSPQSSASLLCLAITGSRQSPADAV